MENGDADAEPAEVLGDGVHDAASLIDFINDAGCAADMPAVPA